LLKIQDLYSGYGTGNILQGLNANIEKGELVGIIGRNGMGKTTLIKTIIGLTKINAGNIEFRNQSITFLKPYIRACKGIGYIPQGRNVFPRMTVLDNLRVGELVNKEKIAKRYDLVFDYFPILYERKNQLAGTLSGGQQSMLSIARALVGNPYLVLLDEPSEGIQPNIVFDIAEKLKKLNKQEDITIMIVEQNMKIIQMVSQRIYIIENGKIVQHLTKEEVNRADNLTKYLAL
jgi:branched-chain amino acid transport system ATP-binding protein